MKKEYMTPAARVLSIGGETIMLSASLPATSTDETDSYFSNGKGGWSSEDWSGEDEE